MAEYTWTGAIDGDLDKPGNYTVGGDVAAVVPTAADALTWVGDVPSATPSSGTSLASIVFVSNGSQGGAIQGGTWHGTVWMNANTGEIIDGTFNGDVLVDNYGRIYAGTFNGNVTVRQDSSIYGGTFNGDVTADNFIVPQGTFNSRLKMTAGNNEWLYSPNSPHVAPASAVKAGVSNLGTPGTLQAAGIGPVVATPAGASWTNRRIVIATPDGAEMVDP